jgi:putative intracellular protease/amidase
MRVSGLFIALLCLISVAKSQVTNEEEQIRQTLLAYINGRNNGDTALLSSAFHPTAELRYIRNGVHTIWPVQNYVSGFTPGSKTNCIARIIYIDILGNAAQAKVELEYPKRKYADYFNLLKENGKWVISGKIFSNQAIDSSKRVLFVMTSHDKFGNTGSKTGLHLGEVANVFKPLAEDGFEIDFVSPKGGKSRIYGMDLNDSVILWFVQNQTAWYRFTHAMKPDDVQAEKYSAVYFAGGHGAMWDLPDNQKLMEIARSIYEKAGVVSAVCHGPAGLVNIKLSNGEYLVKGKILTSFTNAEEKEGNNDKAVPFLLETVLKERGALFKGQPNWEQHVQADGRLITGQNPASAKYIAEEIIKVFAKGQTDSVRYAKGQYLISERSPVLNMKFDDQFQYAGQQTFTLFENSLVTQLYFAKCNKNKVEAFFTIQFEEYLPGIDLKYNYKIKDSLEINGVSFLYSPVYNEPNKTLKENKRSDVWHKYRFLQSKGLSLPDEVAGHRFVKVIDALNKKEVLVVYNEDIKLSNTTFSELDKDNKKLEAVKTSLLKKALSSFSILEYQ